MPDDLLKYRGDGETAVSEAILRMGYKTLFNPKASVYHRVSTSRMSYDYMYKRGYIQGISNSYSEIRKKGTYNYFNFLIYLSRYGILRVKNSLRKLIKSRDSPMDIFNQGYLEGFRFHQKNIVNDTTLLEWVLKKDYLT
jgi:hypothetical protein